MSTKTRDLICGVLGLCLLLLTSGCKRSSSPDEASDDQRQGLDREAQQALSAAVDHTRRRAPSSLRVAVFPDTPDRTEGPYTAALLPQGVAEVWDQTVRHLKQFDSTNEHLSQLAGITVSVEPGPETATRVQGDEIVISEGHIRAGTLFAYATARLILEPTIVEVYNKWYDFLIDALVYGDGIVHLDDDYSGMRENRASAASHTNELLETFEETLCSWVAILLCHEAAHVVLDHTARFSRAFPNLPETVAAWPEGAAALSRQMEIEADQLGLGLCVEARKFHAGAFSCWHQWQLARYVGTSARIDVDATASARSHPLPTDRFKASLQRLHELGQIDSNALDLMSDAFGELSMKYERAIRTGQLDALFPMWKRSWDLSVSRERSVKRASKLMIALGIPAGNPSDTVLNPGRH